MPARSNPTVVTSHLTVLFDAQITGAVLAVLTGLASLGYSISRFPKFLIWFRSRVQLIAERNVAIAAFANMEQHYRDATLAVKDLRGNFSDLRTMNIDLRVRIEELESMRPIYEASLRYLPMALEHMTFLELTVASHKIDVTDHAFPTMPPILLDYLAKEKQPK